MPQLKILNSKEIKEILKLIEKQWGAKLKLEYAFLKNPKNRVFIIDKDRNILAVGKAVLNGKQMVIVKKGPAVRIRRKNKQDGTYKCQ